MTILVTYYEYYEYMTPILLYNIQYYCCIVHHSVLNYTFRPLLGMFIVQIYIYTLKWCFYLTQWFASGDAILTLKILVLLDYFSRISFSSCLLYSIPWGHDPKVEKPRFKRQILLLCKYNATEKLNIEYTDKKIGNNMI